MSTLLNFGFTRPNKNVNNDSEARSTSANPGSDDSDENNNTNIVTGTKVQTKRNFNNRWLSEYRWLTYDGTSMKCRHCVASKRVNPFATNGSFNFQRSALERHQISDDHRIATSNKVQAKTFTKTIHEKFDKMKPSVTAMVHTVATMIEEDIADRKFNKLIQMQIDNGCEALKSAHMNYTSNDSYQNLEDSLADAAQAEINKLIAESDFIGIMVDESIDVAINKKLILKVIVNGKSQIVFGRNITVTDGKANTITAAIIKYMTDHEIPFQKVAGFASDGANTMVGRLNGVSTQLKSINPWIVSVHCAARKLALAAFHGAKTIPYLLQFQKTITSIFYFFKYSPTRYQKIKELKSVLGKKVKKNVVDVKGINDRQKKGL